MMPEDIILGDFKCSLQTSCTRDGNLGHQTRMGLMHTARSCRLRQG